MFLFYFLLFFSLDFAWSERIIIIATVEKQFLQQGFSFFLEKSENDMIFTLDADTEHAH